MKEELNDNVQMCDPIYIDRVYVKFKLQAKS